MIVYGKEKLEAFVVKMQ